MNRLVYILAALIFVSCEGYLDVKPNQRLAVPNKLQDLQALLDDVSIINYRDMSAGEISADDYYLTEEAWAGLSDEEYRRMYLWEKDYIFLATANDWFNTYRIIYSANIVLDNISNIAVEQSNRQEWNNVKGQALYFRAKHFFQNALVWANIYDPATAARDLGIPLRTSQDFNVPSVRPSVATTYNQITTDLRQAIELLPEWPLAKTRASRPGALGLLGRVYLAMGKYDSCYYFTRLALDIDDELLDYRTDIDPHQPLPFEQFNKEVIIDGYISHPVLYEYNARVDSNLYHMYEDGDIRKTAYFAENPDGSFAFKGHYSLTLFGGMAKDELFLMSAECQARLGNQQAARDDLNRLLEKRYTPETFSPIDVQNGEELLQVILAERRKELLLRGIRWMDIKRLNRDGADIVLTRNINGNKYELLPNSPRYVLPIPELVIAQSGMPQNP